MVQTPESGYFFRIADSRLANGSALGALFALAEPPEMLTWDNAAKTSSPADDVGAAGVKTEFAVLNPRPKTLGCI